MTLSAVSQTTSVDVKPKISTKGDTLIIKMHVEDARLILGDLLDYEHVDSLLTIYQEKDSINLEIINKKEIVINAQNDKIDNYKISIDNYKKIIDNKDSEISIFLTLIKDLEKDIKKLTRQKKLAIIGAITGPIITVIIMGIFISK